MRCVLRPRCVPSRPRTRPRSASPRPPFYRGTRTLPEKHTAAGWGAPRVAARRLGPTEAGREQPNAVLVVDQALRTRDVGLPPLGAGEVCVVLDPGVEEDGLTFGGLGRGLIAEPIIQPSSQLPAEIDRCGDRRLVVAPHHPERPNDLQLTPGRPRGREALAVACVDVLIALVVEEDEVGVGVSGGLADAPVLHPLSVSLDLARSWGEFAAEG